MMIAADRRHITQEWSSRPRQLLILIYSTIGQDNMENMEQRKPTA